jgi:hypothetical protein
MPASRSISQSEFLSSLPPWRRLLATFNWHPRLDAQISAIESRRESERLKIENARLAALESKLDSLLLSADSCSPIPPATDCN